jgi:Ger(x)C family germination protein
VIIVKKNNTFILIIVLIIFLISFIGSHGELVENLDVPVAVGYDTENLDSPNPSYNVSLSVYSFEESGNVLTSLLSGESFNLGETREKRQLKTSKRFILGLNRIFLFSEATARFGVKNYIDILLNNPQVNDRAICVVCKGTAEDMLKFQEEGSTNSAEYIEGMVKNLRQYNFFSMQYTLMDLIVRMDAEGRNTLLPYIVVKDKNIETTGLAIFKGNKMVAKADIKDARTINILKENNVNGILTLQKNPQEYINFYTNSKRKIKCYKKGGKYNFVIDVNLKGAIVNNELYPKLGKDPKEQKKFQEAMKNSTEKMLNDTINKINKEYKVDVLDLGRVAAAKYGKGTGVDWNEIVSASDIKVNVKVIVDTEGRGNY